MRLPEMDDDPAAVGVSRQGLMKFCIKNKERLPKAIHRIAAEQLTLAADATAAPKTSANSIHDARKAIKRTRALLKMLRRGHHQTAARREDRALGDAARRLAPERDIHVQWAALTCLPICGENGICKEITTAIEKSRSRLGAKKARPSAWIQRCHQSCPNAACRLAYGRFGQKTFRVSLEGELPPHPQTSRARLRGVHGSETS